jgi:hypothetical protein
MGQWYPQIATYDRYGWDKNQFLDPGEFHDEYGTFDVDLSVPRSFLIGYTGVLLNPDSVYSDSVRANLKNAYGSTQTHRIADFSKADWKAADTARLLWQFHAENVRDFAWCANEHYIWDLEYTFPDGAPALIAGHALYFDDQKKYWSEVAHMTAHAVGFFSKHYGLYAYPSMFSVEGVVGGGMEYPGITFNGHIGDPNSHELYGVISHEIGHSWFPMMIESNETYFAFMDEGFNTYITTTAMEDYYGRYNNSYKWTTPLARFFNYDNTDDRASNQRDALGIAKTGYEEPIATHVYRFAEPALEGTSIYAKTGSVMFMLQYVLGDSVFAHCMKEYFRRYEFKHVYPEDFYTTMQEASGNRDLRWFFNEWFERTFTCDYGVSGLSYDEIKSGTATVYRTSFKVHRYDPAIMPVDVRLDMADGTTRTVWFPIDKWINAEVQHDTTVDLPSPPVKAELNPDGRILDINRLNNVTGMTPLKLEFDNTYFFIAPLDTYLIKWRPTLWYTDEGGFNVGAKFDGAYLDDLYKLHFYPSYNFHANTFDYDLGGGENTYKISPLSSINARVFHIEGRYGGDVTVDKGLREHFSYPPFHDIKLEYSFIAADDRNYLYYPSTWDYGKLQRAILSYQYDNRWEHVSVTAKAGLEGTMALFGENDFQYSKRTIDIRSFIDLPWRTKLALRVYNGMGFGSLPDQAKFYADGASPLEQFESPFYRSSGIFPSWMRQNSIYPGDGNMRGYYESGIAGDKMEAINAEARFGSILPFVNWRLPLLDYLTRYVHSVAFVDAGRVANAPANLWDQRYEADLGVGLRLNSIPQIFGETRRLVWSTGITTFRVDFPFYVTAPPPGESKLKFRWVFGLNETI